MKICLYALQLAVTLMFLMDSQGAMAQESPAKPPKQTYFTLLSDIPLMPGMSEVSDQSFVFDKAEGRVVETVGFLSDSSSIDPIKYYESVLGQLGWKPLKTAVFERSDEQLVVRAEKVAQGHLVRFQLSPVSR